MPVLIPPFRVLDGWLHQRISKKAIVGLGATRSFGDELWSLLEYYSEVEEMGKDFLKSHGISHPATQKKMYSSFQAYIRQAKNYYKSAQSLHYRSSGLLYYYSFLNLTKALLILDNHGLLVDKKIKHGLEYQIKPNKQFDKERITTFTNGVFPMLYKHLINQQLPNKTSLQLKEIFSYCTDVNYQYESGNFGHRKTIPSLASFVTKRQGNNGEAWMIIGIPFFELVEKYPSFVNKILSSYEKIDLPNQIARELFNLDAAAQKRYTFFQDINPKAFPTPNVLPTLELRDNLINTFGGHFSVNYFKENHDFNFSLPYKITRQYILNELIAIYLIMFYISNIVRYKPYYLEDMLTKKEAWLIESFIESCPLTFLRIITSEIMGKDFILESR